MKTPSISQNDISEKWYVVDAAGMRVGRVATIAAELLLGKKDPLVRDYLDARAHVIVLNSEQVDITPKRSMTKFYKKFSGYPGGQTIEDLDTKFKKNPNFVIENAVKGMLPKNTRGRNMFSNLKVYTGAEHDHSAQKPEIINVKEFKV